MTLTAQRLLNSFDQISFPQRQRLLAETARALIGSAELAALLDDLDGRGEFAQRTALQLAQIAGDRAYVTRCLAAERSSVAAQALSVAVKLGLPAEVFLERLSHLPLILRQLLYRSVRQRRLVQLADQLLPSVRERYGDTEAAALLPACSTTLAAAVLPELEYAVRNWESIGRKHPAALLAYVNEQLSANPHEAWGKLWLRLGGGVAEAANAEPELVLELLERVVAHVPLSAVLDRVIVRLARRFPDRVVRLLLDPRNTTAVPNRKALWRAVAKADDQELVGLATMLVHSGTQLVQFFRALPPSRRASIYTAALGERDLASSRIFLTVLDQLPTAARSAEASRLLSLRSVADNPSVRLEVTARLPWAQAQQELLKATRRATADERIEAYPLYIKAAVATREQDTFAEMLTALTRIANEQDPVRSRVLTALTEVPSWLYSPDSMPVLVRLMTDAIQARDSSWVTQQAIRGLATQLIRQGALSGQLALAETGLVGLELLGGYLTQLNLYHLDRSLPGGTEHEVFAALRPRIIADAQRGRYSVALALADGLGRRAWNMPDLQEFIGKACTAKDDGVVRRAIGLWLQPASTRDERVARILRDDRSTITLHAVQQAIAWRRTDLLDTIFSRPLHGRFLKRGVRHIPTFGGCFQRWLPRQIATYADLLTKLARSRQIPTHERATALRTLGRVPGTANKLNSFLTDPEVQVVEAALSALAWTDEPGKILPTLLSYADTDRARVAIYAVARCARFVQPQLLVEQLRPMLNGPKVTSRKEAVRLLAQYRVPGAVDILANTWDATNQHRDVRRAIVSATRWLLDEQLAWELLDKAVASEQAVAVAVSGLDPQTIAEKYRTRYAKLVRSIAESVDPDTAREGLGVLPRWCLWDATSIDMLVANVSNLTQTATWRIALNSLTTVCATVGNNDPLLALAERLLLAESNTDPAFDAQQDRDRPARQRLTALVKNLTSAARISVAARNQAGLLVDTFAESALHRQLSIELCAAAIPWEQQDVELEQIQRLASLADRPSLAQHAAMQVSQHLAPKLRRLSHRRLLMVTETLATGIASAALLSLTIATAVGDEAGWPEEWRAVVRNLRCHVDIDIRLAALDVFTSSE